MSNTERPEVIEIVSSDGNVEMTIPIGSTTVRKELPMSEINNPCIVHEPLEGNRVRVRVQDPETRTDLFVYVVSFDFANAMMADLRSVVLP